MPWTSISTLWRGNPLHGSYWLNWVWVGISSTYLFLYSSRSWREDWHLHAHNVLQIVLVTLLIQFVRDQQTMMKMYFLFVGLELTTFWIFLGGCVTLNPFYLLYAIRVANIIHDRRFVWLYCFFSLTLFLCGRLFSDNDAESMTSTINPILRWLVPVQLIVPIVAFSSQLLFHFRQHFGESSQQAIYDARKSDSPSGSLNLTPSSKPPNASPHAESMAHVLVALLWTAFWHMLYYELDPRLNLLNVGFMLVALVLYTAEKSAMFGSTGSPIDTHSSLRDDLHAQSCGTGETWSASSLYYVMCSLGWFFYCVFTGCLSSPFLLNFMLYALISIHVPWRLSFSAVLFLLINILNQYNSFFLDPQFGDRFARMKSTLIFLNLSLYLVGVYAFMRSPSGWLMVELFGEEEKKDKKLL